MGEPWPLPKLMKANRNAMTVFGALWWMAKGKRQLSTTRKSISKVSGIRDFERISTAMHALNDAGWLSLAYGCNGKRTWYRITIANFGHPTWPGKAASRARRPCSGKKPLHRRRRQAGKSRLM